MVGGEQPTKDLLRCSGESRGEVVEQGIPHGPERHVCHPSRAALRGGK